MPNSSECHSRVEIRICCKSEKSWTVPQAMEGDDTVPQVMEGGGVEVRDLEGPWMYQPNPLRKKMKMKKCVYTYA